MLLCDFAAGKPGLDSFKSMAIHWRTDSRGVKHLGVGVGIRQLFPNIDLDLQNVKHKIYFP